MTKFEQPLQFRDAPELDLTTRTIPLSARQGPASLDKEARTVEVVAATERPVEVYDWSRMEVIREILLMSGLDPLPDQLPLLDSHGRYSVEMVQGSAAGFRIEGEELICSARFSAMAEESWTRVREGHVTDFSIGYRVEESVWVEEGTTAEIDGRSFTGPVRVVTRWRAKELSICPIGADEQAKVRAAAKNPPQEATMNKRFIAYLVSRGLAPEATEEQALRFAQDNQITESDIPADFQAPAQRTEPEPPPADNQRSTPPPPPVDNSAEATRAERTRVTEINALCRQFDAPAELTDQLIADGQTIDQARAQILDHIAERNSAGQLPAGSAQVLTDERDKFRAAGIDALTLRVDPALVEAPAPGTDELRSMTLRELARESLRVSGRRTGGHIMDIVGRALTSSDFPHIIDSTVQRSLMSGYELAGETWDQWCAVGSVSDFKAHKIVRASELDDLEEIPAGHEYRYGDRDEAYETYSIAKYGKMLAITREAIINDDLGAMADIPRRHGEAAARKIGDVAYAVLTANAAMGDGTALFHADHSNLMTGSAIDVTNLGLAVKAMKTQKDIKGIARLNLRPQFLLAPVALETSAEQFFRSELIGTQAEPNKVNIYGGSYFTRIYEPRLDDDDVNGWYLAGPKGKTVTVFFLGGNQVPFLDQREGWNVDGIEYKVRIEAGAKALDWRGLVSNPGA